MIAKAAARLVASIASRPTPHEYAIHRIGGELGRRLDAIEAKVVGDTCVVRGHVLALGDWRIETEMWSGEIET